MAEHKATLLIQLKDEATSAINKLKGVVGSLAESWLGVSLSLAGVLAFAADSVRSFLAQEEAINRLNVALRNQNFYSKEYSQNLVSLAEELQKVTTFSNESILETMGLLTTFGLAGEKLRQTTNAALDLSKGLGIDLHTATMLLGKAWAGETGTLARYGLKISETADKAQKFQEVLEQVNSRFGGSAQAATDTYTGKIAQLANRFDDLKKKIGVELIPILDFWVTKLNAGMEVLERQTEKLNSNARGRQLTIQAQSKEIALLEEEVGWIRQIGIADESAYAGKVERLGKLRAAREREIEMLKAERSATGPSSTTTEPESQAPRDIEAENELGKARLEARLNTIGQIRAAEQLNAVEMQEARIQNFVDAELAITEAQDAGFITRLEAEKLHMKAAAKLQATSVKDSEEINRRRLSSTITMLTMLAQFSNAKSKELAFIGKAAAIAQATVNAHLAASQAFAAFAALPPVAFAMSALMYAAGMAQVAQISGVKLAEGGMVVPRNGGTLATIGEAGKSEAVIPLDDPRTKEKLADVMGGDMTTININAGTIVASDYSVEMFAKRIDEEFYRLKRRRDTTSI